MVGAGVVAAFLSFGQAHIANAGAINRAGSQWVLNAAPPFATSTDLSTCLADEVRRALAITNLRHRAAAGGADWPGERAAQRVDINGERERGC